MKRIIAAALAAMTPLAPLSAGDATPITAVQTEDGILLHDHIRTSLHGESGPVVVLIPGMSTPGAMWDDHVAALEADHRLLVVEVRGFDGERGTDNEKDGALKGIVADIAADLKARDLGPATLVGHSLGGLLALHFGLDHPELAERLMIVDALPFFGTVFGGDVTLETALPHAERMRDMMIAGAEKMREAGVANTTSGSGAMGMSVNEETRVVIANWSLDAEPLAVAQLVYEDTMSDLRQDIAGLTMPVTVLHMANGQYRDMAIARYTTDYAALAGARLVPVGESGHFVQLDQPEKFRAELAALLLR